MMTMETCHPNSLVYLSAQAYAAERANREHDEMLIWTSGSSVFVRSRQEGPPPMEDAKVADVIQPKFGISYYTGSPVDQES